MDDGPPDRQGGKSSRAELGGSGLTPLKATRARSAEEDPDEAVIVPNGEPPSVGDRAGLERSDFAVRRLPLIFAWK